MRKAIQVIKYCKKNYIITSISAIIFSWFISWILDYIFPNPNSLTKKEITCTLNYSQPLIKKATADEDFKIIYKDSEIENPFLYSITIKNTGDDPILNEHFKEPLSINFYKSNKIIKASVIESSNEYIFKESIQKASINGSTLSISDLLLNQGEYLTIHIITDGKANSIIYNHRTIGIPTLTIKNTPKEKRSHITIILFSLLALSLIITIAIPIFIIMDNIKWRKKEKEYQQKLKKYSI